METGSIIWIAPSKCSKRDDEIQVAIKERASSIQIENSVLKVAQTTTEVQGDTGSELKLQWCWQRRGVAFDRCGLMSWSVHEKWVSTMLNQLSKDTPHGYGHIKVEQLIRADRELFTILSQENIGSLKPDAAGVSPLDARVRALMTDTRITMFMLPLPTSQRLPKEETEQVVKSDPVLKPPKVKKAKKARVEKACPEELKKYKMNYSHGRICWAFNLKDGRRRNQAESLTNATRAFMSAPIAISRGTVPRFVEQPLVDMEVRGPQGRTLQLGTVRPWTMQ